MLSDTAFIELFKPDSKRVQPRPVFNEISDKCLTLPDASKYASRDGGVLWSLREAIARFDGKINDLSYLIITRSVGIYFRDISGKILMALDDSSNFEENLALSRAQDGYFAHISREGVWQLSKNDDIIKKTLNRADRLGRIVEVDAPREFGTRDGFEFDFYRTGQVWFGNLAGLCGAVLNKHGFSRLAFYQASVEYLESRLTDTNHVEVRWAGLSVNKDKPSCSVVANYPFFHSGYACGIRSPSEFRR